MEGDPVELCAMNNTVHIPPEATEILITGRLTHLTVPPQVTYVMCSVGLESITLHDNVQFLYLDDNKLTTIDIPPDIVCLHLARNCLTHVTCRSSRLTSLFALDIRNNCLSEWNIRLPLTVDYAWMTGNLPGFRVKYWDWVFGYSEDYAIMHKQTDIFDESILLPEHIRYRLSKLCERNIPYVDLERLDDDAYIASLGWDMYSKNKMEGLLIRRATPEDVDAILVIQHTCYEPELWETKETFLRILECNHSWVACAQGTPVAYALCHKATVPPALNTCPSEPDDPSTPMFIHDLAVHPDHRNKEIATQLLQHIPDPCTLLSLPHVVRFWKGQGFTGVTEPLPAHIQASYGKEEVVWMRRV